MSATIDERVVEMRFDNKQFEQAASQSLDTLKKLDQVIDKSATGENVGKIAKSIDGLNFGNAISGVESLSERFSALGIIGKRVLENITDTLMGKFSSAVHSVTGSIISGGINRAMNIENARFQLQGLIDDTKAAENGFKDAGEMVQYIMDQASESVDGTAYAYDSAAKAASMFSASGVKAGDDMTLALKAVAGVAATTNSEYDDISRIFTTVAGNGRLMADQLNQLSSRGMNAAAALVDYFNKVNDGSIEASDDVTKAIKKVTGGLQITEGELREFVSKGKISFAMFSEAMGTTFGEHAKDANKTFNGAMSNIRAALARTGAMFVSPLIEQNGAFVRLFNSIRQKINEANKALAPFANTVTTFIRKTVKDLSRQVDQIHMGTIIHSITMALTGVGNVLKGLATYIRPIGQAFNEAFGGNIYNNIINLSRNFIELTKNFKASEKATTSIKTAFKGVFDVIKMLINLLGRLVKAFLPASETGEKVGDSILDMISAIGQALSTFAEFVNESELVSAALEKIHAISTKTVEIFTKIGSTIAGFFSKVNFSKIVSVLEAFKHPLKAIGELYNNLIGGGLSEGLKTIIDRFRGFRGIGTESSAILNTLAAALGKVRDTINQFKPENFNFSPLKVLANGLANAFGAIGKALAFVKETATTVFTSLFDAFTGKRPSVMAEALAKAIVNISEALSDVIRNGHPIRDFLEVLNKGLLSGILMKTNKLFKSFQKFTNIKLGQASQNPIQMLLNKITGPLQGTTNILNQVSAAIPKITKGIVKDLNSMSRLIDAKAIKEIAISIGILAGSLFVLSLINPDQLAVGLGAVTIMLGELVATMVLFQKVMGKSDTIKGALSGLVDAVKLNLMAGAMMKLALAVIVLSVAVKMLSDMSWEELAKGLGGVTVLLLELGAFTKLVDPKKLSSTGVGLIATAVAIRILVKAVNQFGNMDLKTLAKGLVAVGVALLEFAAFTKLSGKGGFGKGAGLLLMATSMLIVGKVLQQISTIPWEGIEKGVFAMGAALLEMVIALNYIPDKAVVRKAFSAIEMATAMWIIAQSLVPLAKCDPDNLLMAVLEMGTILFAMDLVLKTMPDKGVVRKAFAAIEMATAMVLIAKALVPLTKCDPDNLLMAVLDMSAVLFAMDMVLKTMPEKGSVAKAFSVIEMAGAMCLIAKALTPLAQLDTDGLLTATLSLGGILLAMTASLETLSRSGSSGKLIASAFSAIEMAAALLIVAKSLEPLAQLNPEGLLTAMVALGAVLLAMTLSLTVISKSGPMALIGAASAIGLAAALLIVTKSLEPLAAMEIEHLTAAVLAMSAMLLAMVLALAALSVAGPMALIGMVSAIGMAAAMVIVSKSLEPLTKVDSNALTAAVIAMGAALLELALALLAVSAIGPAALIGAASAIGMAAAMAIVAASLKILSSIPADQIIASVKGLGIALGVLAGVTALMGTIAPLMMAGSAALLVAAMSLSATMLVLAPSLSLLADTMTKFNSIDANKFSGDVPKLAVAVATLGLAMKTFGLSGTIGAVALKAVAEGLNILVPVMGAFNSMNPNVLARSFVEVAKGISQFGAALKDFGLLSGIGASSLNTVASAVQKIAPALMMLSRVPGERIFAIMTSLSLGFAAFGKAMDEFGLFSGIGASAMNSLADAVNKLAPAMILLSTIPGEQIATIMGALGAGFKIFGQALDDTPFWGTKTKAEGITILCDGVKKIAEAIPALAEIDQNTLSNVMAVLGKAFQDFGTAIDNAPLFGAKDRAEAIGVLCEQISKLADGLRYFMDTMGDTMGIGSTLKVIGDAFQDFGKAIDNAPLFNSGDRAEAIGTLCDKIKNLADGLQYFLNKNLNAEAMNSALDIIGRAFTNFGNAISNAPLFGSQSRAEGIATLVDSIKTLSDGLNDFIATANADGFDNALTKVQETFVAFGNALSAAPLFGSADRATGITTLVDSIHNLADGLKYFCNEVGSGDNINNTLDTIGNAMVSFGDAIKSTPFFNASGRADAIISVIESLGTLGQTIQQLAAVEGSAYAVGVITVAVEKLGAVLKDNWKSVSMDTVNTLKSAFETIQFLGTIDANSISAMTTSLSGLVTVLQNMTTNLDPSAITALSDALTQFAQQGITEFCNAFSNSQTTVTSAVTGFVDTAVQALGSKKDAFTKPGSQATEAFFKGMKDRINLAQTTANEIINKFLAAIKAQFGNIRNTGMASAEKYIEGIRSKFSVASSTGTTLANQVINSLKALYSVFYSTGVASAEKYIEGIRSKYSVASSAGTTLGNQVINALKALYSAFYSTGQASAQKYIDGINSKQSAAKTAGSDLAKQAVEGLKSQNDSAKTAGEGLGGQFNSGVDAKQSAAKTAGSDLAKSAKDGIDDYKDQFEKAGEACATGFANGISSKESKSKAAEAGKELARKAVEAIKKEANINSPSKVTTWLGTMMGKGLVKGLVSTADLVSATASDLATSSVGALKSAIDQIYTFADDFMDVNPTITPEVDMSNIQKAADKTTALFNRAIQSSASSAIVATANLRTSGSDTVNANVNQNELKGRGGNTYNFIQNNTSPLALSRVEIYRQTRNQFSQFKEAVESL